MTDAQYAQILAVVGLTNETKRLAIGYQVPIDDSLRSTGIGRPRTGALRQTGLTAPMVLDGPMTGAAFLAYVEQSRRCTQATSSSWTTYRLTSPPRCARRSKLRFLPPYSPDFNPIENAFSKLKAVERRFVPSATLKVMRIRAPSAMSSPSAR